MVWLSILVSMALLVGGAVYSFWRYTDLKDKPGQTANEAKAVYFNEGKLNLFLMTA